MPIITISRGTQAGARAVASAVADRLELPLVSRELTIEASEDAGVSEHFLNEALEKPPSYFDRVSNVRDRYLHYVRTALCQRAVKGGFVYHGHGGHLLLSDLPNVLRVRVVAPMPWRVNVVMEQLGYSEKKAVRYITRISKQREKWARFLYGVQWDDATLYDLVLNIEQVSTEQAAGLVCKMAKLEQFERTAEKRKRIADIDLANRVESALTGIDGMRNTDLQIVAKSGMIEISGRSRFAEVRANIVTVAQQVQGVTRLNCKVTTPSDVFRD